MCLVLTCDTSHKTHCFAGCQKQTCWVQQALTLTPSMLCFQTFPAQLQHQMPTNGNGVTLVQHRCCMTSSSMLIPSHSLADQHQSKRQEKQEQQQQHQKTLQPLCSRTLQHIQAATVENEEQASIQATAMSGTVRVQTLRTTWLLCGGVPLPPPHHPNKSSVAAPAAAGLHLPIHSPHLLLTLAEHPCQTLGLLYQPWTVFLHNFTLMGLPSVR